MKQKHGSWRAEPRLLEHSRYLNEDGYLVSRVPHNLGIRRQRRIQSPGTSAFLRELRSAPQVEQSFDAPTMSVSQNPRPSETLVMGSNVENKCMSGARIMVQ